MFKWLKSRATASGQPEIEASSDKASPRTFLNGAFRMHRSEDVEKFTALAVAAFPELNSRITCFGSDWAGNQFATDMHRIKDGNPQILLIEPGVGEILQIPTDLSGFYNVELMQNSDAIAAYSFFQDWIATGGRAPDYNECIGYKKPLYLGGQDEVGNLELVDFEVYWGVLAQILDQVRGLPVGTKIGSASIC